MIRGQQKQTLAHLKSTTKGVTSDQMALRLGLTRQAAHRRLQALQKSGLARFDPESQRWFA
jgi:predicted ArsR family transcriptional regulator